MKAFILTIFVVIFIGTIIIIYRVAVEPRNELERHEQINKQMTLLRDRAKANPPDKEALNSLIKSLTSKDSFERTAAIGFLGQVGSRAEPGVDALIEALSGGNPFDAREAARSLGEIGPSAQRSVQALIQAVERHPDTDVGWFAAESLGSVADANDASVIKILEQAARTPDERMRKSATTALRILESNRSKP